MRDDVVTPEQLRALTRSWWIAVVLGVLSIVAGGIVLARPDHSLRALAVIIGVPLGMVQMTAVPQRTAQRDGSSKTQAASAV